MGGSKLLTDESGNRATTWGACALRRLAITSARFLSREFFTLAMRSALRWAAWALASRPLRNSEAARGDA
eukprot:scaffold359549_cov40-Prasinocladus_malaysianus.AAC.1